MTEDRRRIAAQFAVVDQAYRSGDLARLREALGDPPDFPNCRQPPALGVGDHPLEYAIYWSPFLFIEELLAAGADPNYPDPAGFPSLIAALSSGRPDLHDILRLLIERGADVGQRGLNDWTALHYAVNQRDLNSVTILLKNGADSNAKARIDDCTSPLEDADRMGFAEAVDLFRRWPSPARTSRP
jgi:ankyrin repeat protein